MDEDQHPRRAVEREAGLGLVFRACAAVRVFVGDQTYKGHILLTTKSMGPPEPFLYVVDGRTQSVAYRRALPTSSSPGSLKFSDVYDATSGASYSWHKIKDVPPLGLQFESEDASQGFLRSLQFSCGSGGCSSSSPSPVSSVLCSGCKSTSPPPPGGGGSGSGSPSSGVWTHGSKDGSSSKGFGFLRRKSEDYTGQSKGARQGMESVGADAIISFPTNVVHQSHVSRSDVARLDASFAAALSKSGRPIDIPRSARSTPNLP